MIFELLFWLSAFLMLHSYLLYPLLLQLLAKGKKENSTVYEINDELPEISILISVHNEESVIARKIESSLTSDYPAEKIEVLIGSDASDDKTNEIVTSYLKEYPALRFFAFETRQGKPSVINQLVQKAKGEILVLSDVNVQFEEKTLFELIRHFRNNRIGLTDTVMNPTNKGLQGIAYQEHAYIKRETKIKHHEGLIWGALMGPFGGCYAVRRELFRPVPNNFLVDDFYTNMSVLSQNRQSISSLSSRVFEDVSHSLKEEFRRKIRIATGNFQNLKRFAYLAWPPYKGIAFAFLSHKIIRWFGPILILLSLTSCLVLMNKPLYKYCLILQASIAFLAVIDYLFGKIGFHVVFLRFVTHFFSMNLAMFIGMIRFLSGVKSGIWQPTKRNQSERV
jgi:cellulose synthase/poly-beta-1,6-N-acetylglucosamine synthase-like glycosyltransferase